MQLARIGKHLLLSSRGQVQRSFPPAVRESIREAIRQAEATHSGQIRFAVEGVLPPRALFANISAQARALDVFSHLRIWDTEHNNGVLIYVLLADHAVAIVADRGIHAKAGEATWQEVARVMEARFAKGEFETGAQEGIRMIARELVVHFPSAGGGENELPDEVVLL